YVAALLAVAFAEVGKENPPNLVGPHRCGELKREDRPLAEGIGRDAWDRSDDLLDLAVVEGLAAHPWYRWELDVAEDREALVAALLVVETLLGEPLGESLERDELVPL